jgi:hypothetical protein
MPAPLSFIENTQESVRKTSESQPAAKRRKLAGPTAQVPAQSSFADVLAKLKEDASENKGQHQPASKGICINAIF